MIEIVLIVLLVISSYVVGIAHGKFQGVSAVWAAINSERRQRVLDTIDEDQLVRRLKKWGLL